MTPDAEETLASFSVSLTQSGEEFEYVSAGRKVRSSPLTIKVPTKVIISA